MKKIGKILVILNILMALNLGSIVGAVASTSSTSDSTSTPAPVSSPTSTHSSGLKEICDAAGDDRPAICADYDQDKTADSIVKNVINVLIGIVGALSVVMIIYGGVRYTTSAGSPEAVKNAKNTILYAVIGLVIAILAFTIVNFVIGQF